MQVQASVEAIAASREAINKISKYREGVMLYASQ